MAARGHAGQLRRGGNVPYINHPLAVAAKVAGYCADEDMLCAAVLHDAVEDTDISLQAVETAFGARVAGIVAELTDPPEWDDLPTPDRKARQADEYRGASREARIIKMADQWSNLSDLSAMDTGKGAEWLAAYLRSALAVVDTCRAAAPALAEEAEQAGQALARRIDRMKAGRTGS